MHKADTTASSLGKLVGQTAKQETAWLAGSKQVIQTEQVLAMGNHTIRIHPRIGPWSCFFKRTLRRFDTPEPMLVVVPNMFTHEAPTGTDPIPAKKKVGLW